MSKMSLFDKLGVLVDLSTKNQVYLIVLVVLLIFGTILSFTNKKNELFHKVLYFIMTVVMIAILVTSYHSSLGNMIQYMMNNFFIAVYFPNIAIYIAAIIAMNIITWISIFSYKSSKQIRVLNISIYIIMNYLLALLLKVINTNKLDIFDQASLYGNKEATALIELSSIVFVVWVIFLILYKIILIYIRKDYKPRVKRVIVRKKVKILPENFEPVSSPETIYGNIHKEKDIIDLKDKTEDEYLLEQFSKQFTLEDYKLFSRLLKEQQDREKQKETNPVQFKEVNETVERKTKKKEQTKVIEASLLEEDSYRKQQKEEIRKMEEERRRLLEEEKQKQQEKEAHALEELLQKSLEEEQLREQRKLSELEMLYR
ncbi:MAG: hypothetical protein J6X28_03925 [Bacilli bacterium]|nr:hypothetical protein [Bacilli bacterium]